VSHPDPAPADSRPISPGATAEDLYRRVVGELAETITPWFFEFGSWIFGGLIVFTLVLMAPLITLGPVDRAITAATAAFALALPLDVAGLFLLRLVQDLQRVGFEDNLAHAFEKVGSVMGAPLPTPSALEAQRKRRSERVLRASLWMLGLSGVLAVIGMEAVLWRMAWWIAVAFLAMILGSLVIVALAMATALPRDAEAARAQRRRAREALPRQAHARDRANDEGA
jgi:hypothetical protein